MSRRHPRYTPPRHHGPLHHAEPFGMGGSHGSAITQQYVKLSTGNALEVRFPPGVPDEVLEHMLLLQIELAAAFNTWWYLDQWEKGIEPPCCAGCAELRFVPDKMGVKTVVDTAPAIIAAGAASCGPAVAMSLGHERAAKIKEGASWEDARDDVYPKLIKQPGRYWHAILVKDGEEDDPTEEMKK